MKKYISCILAGALTVGLLTVPVVAAGTNNSKTFTMECGDSFTISNYVAEKTEQVVLTNPLIGGQRETITYYTVDENTMITFHVSNSDVGGNVIDYVTSGNKYMVSGNSDEMVFLGGDYGWGAIKASDIVNESTPLAKIYIDLQEYISVGDGWSRPQTVDSAYAYIKYDDGSVPTVSTSTNFSDVPATAYYADAVKWAVEQGITTGTSETTFSPDKTCATAEILTFMWRAAGSKNMETYKSPFTNVSQSDWYANAATWAFQNDMVSGTTLNVDSPCTRAETVTYLWKLAGKPTASKTTDFSDVDSKSEYAQAVAWAVEQGITSGTSENTFSPNMACTRAQIVTFLQRYWSLQ